MKALSPCVLALAQDAYNEYVIVEDLINSRIDYIIHKVCDVYNIDMSCWYFSGAGEGEMGPLMKHIDDESFKVIIEYDYYRTDTISKKSIVLKDGEEWCFADGFPTRWLWEDFEAELIQGKKKYEEEVLAKEAARQAKRKLQADKKRALVASAKSKLTKEELRAIKGD